MPTERDGLLRFEQTESRYFLFVSPPHAHGDRPNRRDSLTHRQVVMGAIVVAIICSCLALVLLYIWSSGMKTHVMKDYMQEGSYLSPGN
eukprot:764271-Hanusia_phi.AAC.3